MPVCIWSRDIFHKKLNLLQIKQVQGHLEVNLRGMQKGMFKIAHPGQISTTEPNKIPACFSGKICIKQIYLKRIRGSIGHLGGAEEYSKIVKELICLDWVAILLDLTYQFIEEVVADYGEPLGGIPDLHFVYVMFTQDAECKKSYLIKEWIDNTTEFIKYINNGCPVPCVPPNTPEEVHWSAEFLCLPSMCSTMKQMDMHIPWIIKVCDFTSILSPANCYLGSGGMLTDPKIILHP